MNDINNTILLVCGVALFLFSLGLIIHLVRKGKSFLGASALIPFALLMIAFPHFKSAKIGEFEFIAQDFTQNPKDPSKKAAFDRQLSSVEQAQLANPTKTLAPETRAVLQSVEKSLAGDKNLSVESRATLARTQLLLGQTKDATTNARTVMTTHPQLVTANPNLRMLVRVTPIPANP